MCKLPKLIINLYRDTEFYQKEKNRKIETQEKWKKSKSSKPKENLKKNIQVEFSSVVDAENG